MPQHKTSLKGMLFLRKHAKLIAEDFIAQNLDLLLHSEINLVAMHFIDEDDAKILIDKALLNNSYFGVQRQKEALDMRIKVAVIELVMSV